MDLRTADQLNAPRLQAQVNDLSHRLALVEHRVADKDAWISKILVLLCYFEQGVPPNPEKLDALLFEGKQLLALDPRTYMKAEDGKMVENNSEAYGAQVFHPSIPSLLRPSPVG